MLSWCARLRVCLATLLALGVTARAADPAEIVVAGYNLENYLIEVPPGSDSSTKPKPEEERRAVVEVIRGINPDILGVIEMGSPADFDDFKKRMAEAGLRYTDFEYVQAADPDRHLALLSRFPISSRNSKTDLSFELNGRQEKVRRGFLDVTVKVNDGYQLRLVGAHLKSKRAAPEGEALLRRNEAHLFRKHLDAIMAADPDVNLLAYGDFNDTKNEPPIQEIMGAKNSPTHMADLWLKDALGDRWTHYWKFADIYSRIDYIFVNRALWPEIVLSKSRIDRAANWDVASDHRPLVTTIRTTNQPAKK